jgi:hypothetical protein
MVDESKFLFVLIVVVPFSDIRSCPVRANHWHEGAEQPLSLRSFADAL